MKSLSRVQLFVTPWIVTYQAPQSMGFSRQEDWSGLPLPSSWPRDWTPGLPYCRQMLYLLSYQPRRREQNWKQKKRIIWTLTHILCHFHSFSSANFWHLISFLQQKSFTNHVNPEMNFRFYKITELTDFDYIIIQVYKAWHI